MKFSGKTNCLAGLSMSYDGVVAYRQWNVLDTPHFKDDECLKIVGLTPNVGRSSLGDQSIIILSEGTQKTFYFKPIRRNTTAMTR